MPIIPSSFQRRDDFNPGFPSTQFRDQWKRPTDVFSVLLILGGDIVARALAQLVGSGITPVAYSFGWVNYAISAVVAAVGDNRLMPDADYPCKVINGSNGFVRDNQSWIIGRMVRDFEYWMDEDNPEDRPISTRLEQVLDEEWNNRKAKANKKAEANTVTEAEAKKHAKDFDAPPEQLLERPRQVGLCVSVYRAGEARPGYPGYDHLYFTGFITCIIQLGLAAIPCGIYGDWSVLLITIAGITLAFISGAIPQWSQEKWACRTKSKKTVALTRGNGSQHAIVIIGNEKGLDLEDLAAAITIPSPSGATKLFVTGLAVLWVLLLITAAGIQENTWFLLATGGVGILQNIYVASARRSPKAFGIPLEFVEVIATRKTMQTLFDVEERYSGVGRSMLATFFPGDLRPEEETKWAAYKVKAKKQD